MKIQRNFVEDLQGHLVWLEGREADMLRLVQDWSAVNSGTTNMAGLGRMAELIEEAFAPLQAGAERISLPPGVRIAADGTEQAVPYGPLLRFRLENGANRSVVMCIHYDTVFPAESEFRNWRFLDDDTLNGPGVADAKGGIVVLLHALLAFQRSPWAKNLNVEVLLNPDEETGSHGSAPYLAEAAARADFGMLYEPAMEDGTLAGARRGSGNFSIVLRGRAAHAGRDFASGRSAIAALGRLVAALDGLNGQHPDVTINIGKVEGGGALNVVPDLAICRINIRVGGHQAQSWAEAKLAECLAAANEEDGISAALHGGFHRPPKEVAGKTLALYEFLQGIGGGLGQGIAWKATGGCCDGNNMSAAGLPNVDTLGVRGGLIHSDQEYMKVSSLVERAKLSAALLMAVARDGLPWAKENG